MSIPPRNTLPHMCLRFADPKERPKVLEQVLAAYKEVLDPNEGFDLDPKHLVVLVNEDNGDVMGVVGLHDDPLETAIYFGWENLMAVEPELHKDQTLEICRHAVFHPYRHQGFLVSPILMFASGVAAISLGAKFVIGNQLPSFRRYTREDIGIPLIAPNLKVISRPAKHPESAFWDEAVPFIVMLGKSISTLAWRFFLEHGLMEKLTIQGFRPQDPLLNSFVTFPAASSTTIIT